LWPQPPGTSKAAQHDTASLGGVWARTRATAHSLVDCGVSWTTNRAWLGPQAMSTTRPLKGRGTTPPAPTSNTLPPTVRAYVVELVLQRKREMGTGAAWGPARGRFWDGGYWKGMLELSKGGSYTPTHQVFGEGRGGAGGYPHPPPTRAAAIAHPPRKLHHLRRQACGAQRLAIQRLQRQHFGVLLLRFDAVL
jgi:hypothetical protein